jgi:hypothetical protein
MYDRTDNIIRHPNSEFNNTLNTVQYFGVK